MTADEAAKIVAELMPIGGTSRECEALTLYVRALHAVKDREIEAMRAERDMWNADARRLSGGLLAIRGAAESVPASVLRLIAYDIALNCIEPDVAEYQIERRAALQSAAAEKRSQDFHDSFEG